ncbi:hypothetical protein PVK06_048380 [Gossypium arboreum]|uniref:Uncharacterized protein n=1 Tax=Gossypium arboreum TaxID=29729 RepID=A0ABR0MFR9_GOSAR|nr:hypothetical protein PVK06_048380 [Gossypium arboreum]
MTSCPQIVRLPPSGKISILSARGAGLKMRLFSTPSKTTRLLELFSLAMTWMVHNLSHKPIIPFTPACNNWKKPKKGFCKGKCQRYGVKWENGVRGYRKR